MTESRATYILPLPLEEDIARDIDTFLSLEGWLVFAFAEPRTHRRLGGVVPEGWFDRLAIRRQGYAHPEYVHIEYKRPGGRLRPSQRLMKRRLEAEGCICYVLQSLDEAAAMLRGLGYALRTRV